MALKIVDPDDSLVGRGPDLARLGVFIADIPRSGGALLLLGEPGVGKTALLAAAARDAEGDGIRVLRTVGVQYRAQAGYSALQQLLASSPKTRTHAASVPVLAAALGLGRDAPAGHDAVTDAVVSLLADLSRGIPTLLLVDDVQWLDHASAVVLGQVARRLLGTGAGMVCAARPGDESFFDYGGLPLHELGPLGDAAAEELLTRRFPALAPRVRRRLMADAEGNPLALLELPAALTDSQRSASQALPKRLPLTHRLQSAFASRIKGLPAATRHLLLVAALEGSGNMQVVRRAVADRCGLEHLAPAERGQLVYVDDVTGRLGFRHSLLRSAVVDLSTSDQRRSVHRALAAAWIGVAEQRAWHLAQAAVEPDEQVAALLEQVADVSAGRADGPDAVAALLRAADLSPAPYEQARRLAKAAYVGANMTGSRDVPRLVEDARHIAPDGNCPVAAVAAAIHLLNCYGEIETIHRLLGSAIVRLPGPFDPADPTMSEAFATLLMVCFYGGRAELWQAFDEAAAKYRDVPELLALARITYADPARARPADLARLDAALAALPAAASPGTILMASTACAYVDRMGTLEDQLSRLAEGARTAENTFQGIKAMFMLGSHYWFAGRWCELRRLVREALELCGEFHYPVRNWPGHLLLARVAAACGDFEAARATADRMEQWAGPRRADGIRHYAAHIRTLMALSEGDFEAAYRHASVLAPAGSLPPFAAHALLVIMDLAEAAVRTGRRDKALDHVRAAQDAGLAAFSPRLNLVVLASAALAAEDDDEADAVFCQALAVEATERWPFDLARVQLYYGERLRRGKAPARARHHLSAAAELFARLGAAPWHERAGKELRACGSPPRTQSARTQAAGIVLTPQQWEIASLAAAGLSNKQIGEKLFLSPRTVSTHLYQLFPKLGITSRAALRDALDRLGRQ